MNKWVLVTGASQGIGYEIARWFAARKYNLVLVARDEHRLTEVSNELTTQNSIQVKVLPKDLSNIASAKEIFDELHAAQIPISILVNNAGFGFSGAFEKVDLQKHLDLMQVNMTSLTQLTHLFLPLMLTRREGKILNVASVVAFLPGPFMAMYYASKSFVYSFSRALSREVRGTGVSVTVLCPGVTRSEFHKRAGMRRSASFLFMSAEVVADIGCRALMAGKQAVVAGWMNRITVTMLKFMPTRFNSWIGARINQ